MSIQLTYCHTYYIIYLLQKKLNETIKNGKKQNNTLFYFCLMIESRGQFTARAKGVNRFIVTA